MASLTRTTKRGSRIKVLAANGLIGIRSFASRSVALTFGYACDEIDRRYEYTVSVSYPELLRMIGSCRGGEISERLTPEEWGQWLRLSKKALGEQEDQAA